MKRSHEREEKLLTISRPNVDGLGAGMPGSYFSTIPRPPDDIFTFKKIKIGEKRIRRNKKCFPFDWLHHQLFLLVFFFTRLKPRIR